MCEWHKYLWTAREFWVILKMVLTQVEYLLCSGFTVKIHTSSWFIVYLLTQILSLSCWCMCTAASFLCGSQWLPQMKQMQQILLVWIDAGSGGWYADNYRANASECAYWRQSWATLWLRAPRPEGYLDSVEEHFNVWKISTATLQGSAFVS